MKDIKRLLLKYLEIEKCTCEIFCLIVKCKNITEKGSFSLKSKQKSEYVKKTFLVSSRFSS